MEASSSSSSSPAAAVPGKIFVGGISSDTDEKALKEHFGRYGKVERAVVVRNWSTGNSRGFGFVTFADDHAAISASDEREKDRHIIHGKKVDVKLAIPKEHLNNGAESSSSNSYRGQNSTGKKIFVGGLPKRITDGEFKEYFEEFGIVTDSIVMRKHDHPEKTSRGFGFVTFATEESAREVLKNQFHELHGKKIEIKKAVPKIVENNSNPSPTTTHGGGGNDASNNNHKCNSVPTPLRNINAHSYAPYYPMNSMPINPYSQPPPTCYGPYVYDNVYHHVQPYTAHYFPYDDPYRRCYGLSPFAIDYSAWYYPAQYWGDDQGMIGSDTYMMEEMNMQNMNLHGPGGDFGVSNPTRADDCANGGSEEAAPRAPTTESKAEADAEAESGSTAK